VITDWLLVVGHRLFGGVSPLLFGVCPSKQSGATKNVAMRIYLFFVMASADYDPAADLRKVRAAVLSINFADDEINPPELGFIARAKEAVPNGEFVLIPASNETAGHQTLARAAVYEKDVADFLAKARSANSR
jgi:homoserine acetyltransferase